MANTSVDLQRLTKLHERMLADFEILTSELGKATFVENAWPRLWFGDVDAYARSEVRIVTAALNPSGNDFRNPLDEQYRTVRSSAQSCASNPHDFNLYKQYCRQFFEAGRRDKWFGSFRKVMRDIKDGVDYNCAGPWRIGSEVDQISRSSAIHLDAFSPFATRDKWSELKPDVQNRLRGRGEPLFKEMIDNLRPHVILVGLSLSSAPSWMIQEQTLSWFGPNGRDLTKKQARSAAISVKIVAGSLTVVGGAAILPYVARGWSPQRRRELSQWLSRELTTEQPELEDDDCADLGHCALPWESLDSYFSTSDQGEEYDPFED